MSQPSDEPNPDLRPSLGEEQSSPADEAPAPGRMKRFFFSGEGLALLIVCLCYVGIAWWLRSTIPDVSAWQSSNPRITAFMRYRMQQNPRRHIPGLSHTAIGSISPRLIQAVLIAEDDKFFQHEGIDWGALRESLESNIKKKRMARGGSTITQQLAKNLYLSPSRSLIRKARELVIAFALERNLSKKRILELYLNVAEWGEGIFGVTAASRHYFAISPDQLTASQAIRLASVLPNPIRFGVLENGNKRMNRKRLTIARRMLQRHWLDEAEFALVLAELGLEG